jgi:hypothetical protein
MTTEKQAAANKANAMRKQQAFRLKLGIEVAAEVVS